MDARVTEQMARRFLLGNVNGSERQRIERLFLTDPEIRETILIAEDDLFDDYLEGNLTADDAQKFRDQYAENPRRTSLTIAQAIREYSTAQSQRASALPVIKKLALPRPTFDWRFASAILASVAIAVMIVTVWMGLRMKRTARENSQRAAIEKQLADLNSAASLNAKPPEMLVLTIPPISVRSVHSSSELALQHSSQVIELHLLWTQKDGYTSYRPELGRVGGANTFKLPPLQLESSPSGRVFRLRLPAALLDDGLYRITVNALGSDGAPQTTEEYDFSIKRP